MSYNGYPNYETWAVKLWLDNEEPTYRDVTGQAEDLVSALDEGEEPDVYTFGKWLEDYCRDMLPDLPASFASDLLGAAFGAVDFRYLAESYLEDAQDAR